MKITAVERLPDGDHLKWTIWKSLNCLKSQVECCKTNMVKWNYTTGLIPMTAARSKQCNICSSAHTLHHQSQKTTWHRPITQRSSSICTGRSPSRNDGHVEEDHTNMWANLFIQISPGCPPHNSCNTSDFTRFRYDNSISPKNATFLAEKF